MKILDYDGASALLNIPKSTLQMWISTGRVAVPHLRVSSRTVRFVEADLFLWLEQRRRGYDGLHRGMGEE